MKPWVLVVLIVLVLASFVGGLLFTLSGGRAQTSYNKLSGAEIYGKICQQCHGPRGTAPTGLANSYVNKLQYWDEESLLQYIANPPKVKRRMPHLSGSGRVMPAISKSIPEPARRKLVTHVLGLMEALEPTD